ncbi:uncharacterized protein [Sinocyclocheilus grahami]|uniref:uncharacterized protein n=1 Tax=Sinocyclocheilus grahami TaxID=75366 RepID=UPI0007AD48B3|nr:PREDICTED: uncharacterized protein LOC107569794 [Sinocyclocheilus grahami]
MEGDPVILQTDVPQLTGDELIVWRFGDEGKLIAKADIEAKSSSLYDTDERFRDRLQLNDQTVSLTITNTRTTDSGLYTAKISSNKQTLYKRFIVTVSVKEVPAKVGESVTLDPGLETLRSDLILWTFGAKNCLVIKAESGTTSISDRFRDRLELNHQTGSLTITNTTDTDFGLFQLQIINRDRTRYRRFNLTDTMNESTKEKPLLN